MSTRRNVNLNKELGNDWVGCVRHWEKKWVGCEEKGPSQAVKPPVQLLKWVQTEERTAQAGPRHPHIVPVNDLSLVPGARMGQPPDAADGQTRQVADPTAVPPIIDLSKQPLEAAAGPAAAAAAAPGTATQQQQQQQPAAAVASRTAAAAAATGMLPSSLSIPDAAAAAASAVAAATPSSIAVIDMPSASALDAAAAATTAGLGQGSIAQPSPSATGGVSFGGLEQLFSSQQELLPMPAAVTASDYTAGTDSEALGRLPNAGVTASDYTAGTDSMDVDVMMGQSQGTASVQRTGEMDMDEEDEEGYEEVSGEEEDLEEEDDEDDDGLIGDDGDDMPG